jgi:hypothetical protein
MWLSILLVILVVPWILFLPDFMGTRDWSSETTITRNRQHYLNTLKKSCSGQEESSKTVASVPLTSPYERIKCEMQKSMSTDISTRTQLPPVNIFVFVSNKPDTVPSTSTRLYPWEAENLSLEEWLNRKGHE